MKPLHISTNEPINYTTRIRGKTKRNGARPNRDAGRGSSFKTAPIDLPEVHRRNDK